MDLFLLAGQSNMCGRGRTDDESKIMNEHRAKYGDEKRRISVFDVECNVDPAPGNIYTYENFPDPMAFMQPKKVGVGPGLRFAERILEEGSSREVGLIPVAVGGLPIDVWLPGTGHCYNTAIERARKAMKKGKLRAILWHQGESDSGEKSECHLWGSKLQTVIEGFRKDLGDSDLPVLVGTLGDYLKENPMANMFGRFEEINAEMRKAVRTMHNCALVESEGLPHAGDFLHFSGEGASRLGDRYFDQWKVLLKTIHDRDDEKLAMPDVMRDISSASSFLESPVSESSSLRGSTRSLMTDSTSGPSREDRISNTIEEIDSRISSIDKTLRELRVLQVSRQRR